MRTVVRMHQSPGAYSIFWDGRDDLRQPVPSGAYYYELSTEAGRQARKAVLVR